ncbi:MAG: DNA polymerase III subunit gamma/tau [Clostridia bacterium]|nr:DNA polymerase III subunit gamma/tau [Clostridia bacterium]
MGYTALYRKYRPLTFSEIVGQDHITKTLKNQIIANRVGHAYLLNGGRGTGKTSAAKILARAINCLNPQDGEPCNECEICRGAINGSLTDIIEMDAASNNGVEDIRSIREEVNFLPTKAKYRVYIIDEVHMLTQGAFNALLKTLEEPPEHVKFILATTEPQKLPATILSRCQRFDYKRISNEDISKRLEEVCKRAEIDITQEAIKVISILAEGAMRDALSILERCVQDGENKIDENKVKELVGIPKTIYIYNIISAIIQYDIDNAIKSMEVVLNEGKDITNFLLEIIKYVKDILIYKTTSKLELYNEEEKEQIAQIAKNITKEELVDLIYNLSELENKIKWSTQKTILFQAGIIKLCSKNSNIKENSNHNYFNYSFGKEKEKYYTKVSINRKRIINSILKSINKLPVSDRIISKNIICIS